MRFSFDEDQLLLQKTLRDFLEKECTPELVRSLWETETGRSSGLWKQLAELGWLGLIIPETHGGAGLGWEELVVMLEETGRSLFPSPLISTTLAAATLIDAGSEAQQKRWLPRLGSWRRPRKPRKPEESTDIAHAMEFLLSVTPRKTICFVVSDFLDEGYEQALRTANRKHDVIGVLITDPREFEIPGVGLLALSDAESGRTRLYDTDSAAFRDQVKRAAERRLAELERRFRSSSIDFIHIDASKSVVEPLIRFFRMRERRTRRR